MEVLLAQLIPYAVTLGVGVALRHWDAIPFLRRLPNPHPQPSPAEPTLPVVVTPAHPAVPIPHAASPQDAMLAYALQMLQEELRRGLDAAARDMLHRTILNPKNPAAAPPAA